MRFQIYITIIFILFSLGIQAQDSLQLTVERVIAYASSDNLQFKKEILKAELAEAELAKAKEWWLPEVFIGTRFHALEGSSMNTDGQIFMNLDRQNRWYGGELDFNWDIGAGLFGTKAKRIAAESASLFGEAAKNEAVVNAISDYYAVLIAAAQHEMFEELIAGKEDLIQQLEVQVGAGLRLESELLLAKSVRQRLMFQQLQSNQQFQEAIANLCITLNINPGDKVSYNPEDLTLLDLVDARVIGIASGTEHPLITANRKQLEAANQAADAVKKSLYLPNAGLRYNFGPFGDKYNNTEFTHSYQAYIGWNLPMGQLIMGGDNKVAAAQQRIASMEIEEQSRRLKQQIAQYQSNLIAAKEVLDMSEQGMQYAEQAMEQATIRQNAGIGNAYEILQAQEEFIQVRLMYINAVANYNLMQYQLLAAMGPL